MQWLIDVFSTDSVPHTVLVLSMVSALGMMFGSIRLFGVSIGVAGVLFSGLLFGHFKVSINHEVMEFIREFGLILFVYTIGLQVGPGFFSSLRRQGLPLNLMAIAVVVLGVVVTVAIHYLGGIDMTAAVGLYSGATTNTPSLGAAQQALKELSSLPAEAVKTPGLAYAVSYPFGIIGVILSLALLKWVFRIKLSDEAGVFTRTADEGLVTVNLRVENVNLEGLALKKVPGLKESGALISRIMQQGQVRVAQADTILHVNDVLLAVGRPEALEQVRIIVGSIAEIDLKEVPSTIQRRRFVITRPEVVGKTPRQLNLAKKYGATISRVQRAEIEFTAAPNLPIQFGDRLVVVGEEEALKAVEQELGNSEKALHAPQTVPVFVGIAIGVLLGSVPIAFPGTPVAIKLGLAGGPLVVAIILSRLGHVGRLVWYMPASVNLMLRELGILMFLSTVGLRAGDRFVASLVEGDGIYWMASAALITVVPILVVGIIARAIYKMNYLTLSGLLAGSMTDPPALAFANSLAHSEAPAISYSTVYPTTMVLRVVSAQLLVFFLS